MPKNRNREKTVFLSKQEPEPNRGSRFPVRFRFFLGTAGLYSSPSGQAERVDRRDETRVCGREGKGREHVLDEVRGEIFSSHSFLFVPLTSGPTNTSVPHHRHRSIRRDIERYRSFLRFVCNRSKFSSPRTGPFSTPWAERKRIDLTSLALVLRASSSSGRFSASAPHPHPLSPHWSGKSHLSTFAQRREGKRNSIVLGRSLLD